MVKACREIFSRAVSVTVWTCPHFIACLGGNTHLVTELSQATIEYPAEVFLCRAVVGIAIVVCKIKMCDTAVECSVYLKKEIGELGFFLAPQVVASALKTSVFACRFFEKLGYKTLPESGETRTDIIASILLENEENLVAFCQGIQKGSPVDSYVTPEAWDMPGYDSKVIMAAGAFTMGASIELSADAPIRPPFAAWLQGGITYSTGKAGVMLAAQEMYNKGLLRI